MSLSDFIVLNKLGEGAYSSVHKVKRISCGNIFALKKVRMNNLKPKEKENSLNEIRLLASISSDYIIKYKEAFFDEKSNTLCIIMQYAEGGDLEKVISKKKRNLDWFSQAQVWKIIRELTLGLQVLHDQNIIHRDIKCANIFIVNSTYKIADLNVSKLMKKELAYTQTGTPYYASPEVWKDKPYELKSDIWSLGCIIYEICALKPPFTATSMQGLYKKVLKGSYPRIPNMYSSKLQEFISKCLQIEPRKRPNAKELLKLLQHAETPDSKTEINLLATIKVPKNIQFLNDQLPKSNYEDTSASQKDLQIRPQNRYRHLSQNKLKQIVNRKNNQIILKRDLNKKIHPESQYQQGKKHSYSLNHQQQLLQSQLRANNGSSRLSGLSGGTNQYLKPHSNNKRLIAQQQKILIKKDLGNSIQPEDSQKKIEVLPRINKLRSEPGDKVKPARQFIQAQPVRYEHSRPSWWG